MRTKGWKLKCLLVTTTIISTNRMQGEEVESEKEIRSYRRIAQHASRCIEKENITHWRWWYGAGSFFSLLLFLKLWRELIWSARSHDFLLWMWFLIIRFWRKWNNQFTRFDQKRWVCIYASSIEGITQHGKFPIFCTKCALLLLRLFCCAAIFSSFSKQMIQVHAHFHRSRKKNKCMQFRCSSYWLMSEVIQTFRPAREEKTHRKFVTSVKSTRQKAKSECKHAKDLYSSSKNGTRKERTRLCLARAHHRQHGKGILHQQHHRQITVEIVRLF